MRHVCDKCKCTLHTRHCEWVGSSTRFQFACALVRMQGHARMLQPSSSGVMHAYVKGRARDGTGTAVPARARLHARNARTGMHGTGCACRCLHELLALRRSAASTCPALERSTAAYFERSRVYRHVILSKELQTLPWGLESTPRSRWHP